MVIVGFLEAIIKTSSCSSLDNNVKLSFVTKIFS